MVVGRHERGGHGALDCRGVDGTKCVGGCSDGCRFSSGVHCDLLRPMTKEWFLKQVMSRIKRHDISRDTFDANVNIITRSRIMGKSYSITLATQH